MTEQTSKQKLFPFKLNQILQTQEFNSIIRWRQNSTQIVIYNLKAFKQKVMPTYFRNHKFDSFVRQMNLYGFKKNRNANLPIFVNPDLQNRKQLTQIQSRNQKKRYEQCTINRTSILLQASNQQALLMICFQEKMMRMLSRENQIQNIQNSYQSANSLAHNFPEFQFKQEQNLPYFQFLANSSNWLNWQTLNSFQPYQNIN